jgi:hypothetical protein
MSGGLKLEAQAERAVETLKSGGVQSLLDLARRAELVEAFPAHYYSEGIESLQGATKYSIANLITTATHR